jgi:hypothetical protein
VTQKEIRALQTEVCTLMAALPRWRRYSQEYERIRTRIAKIACSEIARNPQTHHVGHDPDCACAFCSLIVIIQTREKES